MREKALHALYLLAAVGIVGGALYLLLDKAAPIVAVRPEQPQPSATPAAPTRADHQSAPAPERPRSGIYRCERGSAVVYSDTPCQGGRIVDIQVTQGFQAERYRPAAGRDSSRAAPSVPAASPHPAATNAALCEQINKAIEGIDAAARQGGSIQYMEHLKEERRKLVEKRQELRC